MREATFVCKFIDVNFACTAYLCLFEYQTFPYFKLITLPYVVTYICDVDGRGVCPRYGLDFNISSP